MEPRTLTNPDILAYNILKISAIDDDIKSISAKDMTAEDYNQFVKEMYTQFDIIGLYIKSSLPQGGSQHQGGSLDQLKVTHEFQQGEYGQCLCSKTKIVYHYKIYNFITHESCWVGSDCIRKFFPHLEDERKKMRKQYDNKIAGAICHYCSNPLIDLRKAYQRDGFCDVTCVGKMKYVVPFGKYKGNTLVDLFYFKHGREYIKWMRKEIDKDPLNAFKQHPLLREIIEEHQSI